MLDQNSAAAKEILARQNAVPMEAPPEQPGTPLIDDLKPGEEDDGLGPQEDPADAEDAPEDGLGAPGALPGQQPPAPNQPAPFNPSPQLTPEEMAANPAPADGSINNTMQLGHAQLVSRDQELAGNARGSVEAKQYVAHKVKEAEDEAKAAQPFMDMANKQTAESNERLYKAHTLIQYQMEEKMRHFQSVQDEMADMAAQKPKDLFGEAGVNSVLGRIAIFLGGAGTAGLNGPNENLQRTETSRRKRIALKCCNGSARATRRCTGC
jgi:hypothetical protein